MLPQPPAQGLEGVAFAGMEADDESLAAEQADLMEDDSAVHAQGQTHGHEQRVLVFLDLGALAGIEHVLEGQRVKREQLPELAQGVGGNRALHVNPGDARPLEIRPAFFHLGDAAFTNAFCVVVHQADDEASGTRLGRGLEGPRSGARGVVALGELAHWFPSGSGVAAYSMPGKRFEGQGHAARGGATPAPCVRSGRGPRRTALVYSGLLRG